MANATDGGDSSAATDKPKEFPKTITGKSFGDVDHIVNADGLYLYCRYWKPEKEIRAIVFHIHGYAEHCGRSKELAEKMKGLGIFSFTHDHVGHGESQGLKGEMRDYKVVVRDIWQHIDLIRTQYPDVPIFLYGHSLGGGMAVIAAHERPNFFNGIVCSAPYIRPSPETATPVKVFLAKVLNRIAPKVRVGKLDPSFLSRDKKQIEDYVNDPLNDNDGMRAGAAVQYLIMADDLAKIMPTTDVPMFIAHSEADKICDVGGAKLLIEVSNSKDKTFKLYKDAQHMLEHELPEFTDAYFEEVLKWFQEKIA